jgi:SPW repeat-containing protein
VTGSAPVAAGLADKWWFWALAASVLLVAAAFSGRYRRAVTRVRAAALERGLLELPPGRSLARATGGIGSDLSWLALLVGVWVILGPWTWGYDAVGGAVTTDVVTGAAVIGIALAAIVFPALWALNLLVALWLVTAPWLVGYGDANGPVGLSDSIAGIVLSIVTVASLSASERAVRPGEARAIGRIRPPRS